jgi:hypothetical protein
MSLITKEHLSLVLQTIKKLLSFKADKSEVVLRKEIEEAKAIAIAAEMGLVDPATAADGAIFTDENGAIYSL